MKKTVISFGHACKGILHCIRNERNLKIQLICACLVIIAGIVFQLKPLEWCVIAVCIAIVLSMEMVNTSIEHVCNAFHKEYHPVIRIVKDISAGAVLISACITFFCGIIIFFPKIISFIHSLKIK